MGGKKKLNPNRVPRTTEEKIAYERSKAIKLAYVIFLSVLCDKIGLTNDDLARVHQGCLDLSESIAKGYVNAEDLRRTLQKERGLNI